MNKSKIEENKKYWKKVNKEVEKYGVLTNLGEDGQSDMRFNNEYSYEQMAQIILENYDLHYSIFQE